MTISHRRYQSCLFLSIELNSQAFLNSCVCRTNGKLLLLSRWRWWWRLPAMISMMTRRLLLLLLPRGQRVNVISTRLEAALYGWLLIMYKYKKKPPPHATLHGNYIIIISSDDSASAAASFRVPNDRDVWMWMEKCSRRLDSEQNAIHYTINWRLFGTMPSHLCCVGRFFSSNDVLPFDSS